MWHARVSTIKVLSHQETHPYLYPFFSAYSLFSVFYAFLGGDFCDFFLQPTDTKQTIQK